MKAHQGNSPEDLNSSNQSFNRGKEASDAFMIDGTESNEGAGNGNAE